MILCFSLAPLLPAFLGLPGVLVPLFVLLPSRLQDLFRPLDLAVPPVLRGQRGLHHRRMSPGQSSQFLPPLRYLGGAAPILVVGAGGGVLILRIEICQVRVLLATF